MALSSPCRFSDDNIKLEPKVVLALSRLTKLNKSGKPAAGVTTKEIVQYLKANYCSLDGDVESQVITALLSCVKTGMVCALDNGKYLFPGPGSRGIASKCITRVSHGSKCGCAAVIKRASNNFQKPCCVLKVNSVRTKAAKKATTKSTLPARQPKTRTICKTKPPTTAQQEEDLYTCAIHDAERSESKCNYCLKMGALGGSTSQMLCGKCHADDVGYVAPFDKFSPREEVQ